MLVTALNPVTPIFSATIYSPRLLLFVFRILNLFPTKRPCGEDVVNVVIPDVES